MNPVDLANTKIEIKNDYEGRQAKIQNKIVTHSVKEQVRQGNPDLNEASLDAITELEKQLKKLEGNTTQTGKDKAAAIRTQIKDIQENQLQEEVATEAIPGLEKELREAFDYEYYEENLNSQYDWQVDSAKEFLADPRAYFERFIKLYEELLQEEPNNEAYKDSLDIYEKKIAKWNEINNKYKTEQNAIQEQATDESVLRTGEPQLGLQEVGEGNQGLEVAPTGTQEVAPEGTKEVIENKRKEELDTNTSAGYGTIALDYLLTGGKNVILSTDYLLQALTSSFEYSGKKIDEIRNKYANKLGNIKDDIGTDSYNSAIQEIKD